MEETPLKIVSKFPQPILTWSANHSVFTLHSTQSNLVEVYRVTYEIEKIVDTVLSSKPSTIELSSDGLSCAISFEDGELGLFKVDQMSQISSQTTDSLSQKLFYQSLVTCREEKQNYITTGL